jgi:hypothetical protein
LVTNCGTFNTASLLCPQTNPCRTINFALTQARDGDAIDLSGGTYSVQNQIELDKLVTIQPAPNTSSQQTGTPTFNTCIGLSLFAVFTCNTTLGFQLLSGSSATIAASGNDATITRVQINASGATLCTTSVTTPPSATATINCGTGQSIPSGAQIVVTVDMTPSAAVPVPTVTMTVNAPTISNRPVLQSTLGGPIFHVTAVGSPAMHVTIFGLTLGDAISINNSAAIVLDNDSYTEISHNIIGSQELPNAIGVLLTASDHPLIHDNTIQGSTLFPRTASIVEGVPGGGFGVVTNECFGSFNHSNGVQLINNLFARNSNAGVWFCSDGTGGFLVSQNAIRANGRGIVLYDAVDTVITSNTIGDNVLDGIDLLMGSVRNLITGNIVESQQGNISIGILLGGNGAYFPLGNQITQNQLHRNTVDIAIVGAQGTQIGNNSITAVGTDTGVLFSLGLPGISSGQPLNTVLSGNALESAGSCTATNGCAIRLTAGVTTPIDATSGNYFGTIDPNSIQAQIWDHGRDPALGTVYVLASLPTPTPSGILGLPPTTGPAPSQTPPPEQSQPPSVFTPSPTPPVVITSTPGPSSGTPGFAPVPPLSTTSPGGSPSAVATTYVDPTTSAYYVPLLFCVANSDGTPAASDVLTLTFMDSSGTQIGSTTVTADSSGCFNGNVAPQGGSSTQPASVVASDSGGAKYSFSLNPGSPLTRPPVGPVQ